MIPFVAVLIGVGLIMLSAFFVAVEFAMVAARPHRLEEAAHTSAASRAALRSCRDLSLPCCWPDHNWESRCAPSG